VTLWKRLLCLSTVALCTAFVASAQENAELTGTVKDPSGAVVPNARVTLTNASTAEVRAGTTNAAGLYDFPALNNGTYDLKVVATGFEAYAKTGIVMDVASTVKGRGWRFALSRSTPSTIPSGTGSIQDSPTATLARSPVPLTRVSCSSVRRSCSNLI